MVQKNNRVSNCLALAVMAALLCVPNFTSAAPVPAETPAPNAGATAAVQTRDKSTRVFDELAEQALVVMTKRAEELKIKGAAVLAYIPGDSTQSWSSKMAVVGSLKNAPKGNDRGSNLLGIAYAKAAEMADTLKDSGSAGRPPMTGEFGWQGGLIIKVKTGFLIAAFSGGPSEDDLKVARAGLEFLGGKF